MTDPSAPWSSELPDFLIARYDEEETLAKKATGGPWMTGAIADHLVNRVVYGQSEWPGHIVQACNVEYADPENAEHIARFADPVRVLAEVAAKHG